MTVSPPHDLSAAGSLPASESGGNGSRSALERLLGLELRLSGGAGLGSRAIHGIVNRLNTKMIAPIIDAPVRCRVHGADLYLPLSHALPRYVATHAFYDSALPAFVRHLSAVGGAQKLTVVDVGANVGDTARLVAASAGPEGIRFICIEADESYLPLLRRNTEGLDAAIHHVLAGATSQELSASIVRSGAGTSSIAAGGSTRRVVALDDLLSETPIDLLKIDTDGYEVEVLRGAKRTLATTQAPCFIEFSPWHLQTYGKATPAEVLRLLRDAGYAGSIVYDNLGYPLGLFDLTEATARNLTNYCLTKSNFYVDILAAKDSNMLADFYASDLARFKQQH